MKAYRKAAREAVLRILSDEVTGFNARMADLAQEYFVEPFSIDFSPTSTNFIQSAVGVDTDNFAYSKMFPKPLGMTLYTVGAVNTKDQNSGFFSGQVECRIDAYLQFSAKLREGLDTIEGGNTEDALDAIEEAILLCLHDDAAAWGPVSYNLDVTTARGALKTTGDGWQQRISIILVCGVHV